MTGERFFRLIIESAISFFLVVSPSTGTGSESPDPRNKTEIHLENLRIFDDDKGHGESVRISSRGAADYSVITGLDDYFVKFKRRGREKTLYRETIEMAYFISNFEAENLNTVCKSLEKTLREFERFLQKQEWGKCRYLDAYFPRFLQGFTSLFCAAQNDPEALPAIARIPDSLYEKSLRSSLTDTRIMMWREDKEHCIQLRISARELIHQIGLWRKKDIGNPKRRSDKLYFSRFEEAYGLFIKLYFGIG